MKSRLALFCLSLMVATACGKTDPAPVESVRVEDAEAKARLIADGRAIVEQNCTTCHATGSTDDSPRTDAPPLRHVLAQRDPEALAADFREGIHIGAVDMPDFDFGPLGTDAVLAYLTSIQDVVPVVEGDVTE